MSLSHCNKKRESSPSKYLGVSKKKKGNTWYSFVSFKSKTKRIGSFILEDDAAKARDIEVLKEEYGGIFELNFPELQDQYLRGEIIINKNKNSSNYIGVSSDNKSESWQVHIRYNNKQEYLGSFNNEYDAAKFYDIKAIEYFGTNTILNFPDLLEDYINKNILVNKNTRSRAGIKKRKNSSSNYLGVYLDTQSKEIKWKVSVFLDKRVYLGKFYTEKEAAQAYDIAIINYYGIDRKINFPESINDYLNNIIVVERIKNK